MHYESSFPIDMFLLMGDNYIGEDAMGRLCHTKRKKMELNLEEAGLNEVKRDLYKCLAKIGLGREICMYGMINNSTEGQTKI
jgi:hypothetical protein